MASDLNIKIKINSDTKQLEITQDGFKKISSSAKKTAEDVNHLSSNLDKTVNSLKDFAIAYISLNAAMGMGEYFIETADSLNRLDGRLKLATESVSEFHSQQKELLIIAKETHSPLQNMTDLYVKLDPALSRLGATTDTVNLIVENFAKGLKLGGANASESSAAILQFAQAMGSGVLRGDEFNSMAEASPKLMEYLAKGLKVPQGELRSMAEAGELTAGRVSAALLSMTDEIERDFKQLPKTVGDAAVDFKTEASVLIHEIDKATGATAALAGGIDAAAELISNKNGALDEFTDKVMTAGIAVASIGIGLGVSRIAMASYAATTGIATAGQLGFTTAIIAGTVATKAKTAATGLLRVAMLNLPLIAVAAGVAAISAHFLTAARDANLLTDALAKTNEELQNMSKNQLEAQRSTIERGVQEKLEEIQKAGLEVRQARQRGADKQELNELRAHYDDLSDEYKRLTDQRSKIDAAIHKPKASSKSKDDENAALKKQIEELIKNGAKIEKPKKGKSADEKAAEQLEKDILKARLDALRDNADREADLYLGIYKAREDAAQDSYDREAQDAIERYNDELDLIERNANALASAYDRAYEMITPEIDKFNQSMMEDWQTLYDAGLMEGDFADKFYDAWQKKAEATIDKVKDGTIKLNTVFEDAFKSMEDSMVHMFMTGKFEAEDFFNTVIEGIIRMQIRNSITQPITTAIGSIDFGSMLSGMFAAYDGGMIPEYYLGGAVNNFAYGGYTGDGGKYEPKGVVHGGEYVIPKWQVQRIPSAIMQLESMRKRGYADGGSVGSALPIGGTPNVTINVENRSGSPIAAENVNTRFDMNGMVVSIVVDAINRNVGGARDTVRNVR